MTKFALGAILSLGRSYSQGLRAQIGYGAIFVADRSRCYRMMKTLLDSTSDLPDLFTPEKLIQPIATPSMQTDHWPMLYRNLLMVLSASRSHRLIFCRLSRDEN